MSTPGRQPQTRSKIAEKQRSTRQSTSDETVHVPAFAAGADRPTLRPIKEEPIDFTDLSDLTIDSDDDMEITFGDHQPVLVAHLTRDLLLHLRRTAQPGNSMQNFAQPAQTRAHQPTLRPPIRPKHRELKLDVNSKPVPGRLTYKGEDVARAKKSYDKHGNFWWVFDRYGPKEKVLMNAIKEFKESCIPWKYEGFEFLIKVNPNDENKGTAYTNETVPNSMLVVEKETKKKKKTWKCTGFFSDYSDFKKKKKK
eukprot:SAG11_NODE_530_length_8718_cov_12.724910_1_plen_253_part_00